MTWLLTLVRIKKLTNVRASGSDDALKLIQPREFTLEEALEFIEHDELVEITPDSIRLRKKILNATDRMRANKKNQSVNQYNMKDSPIEVSLFLYSKSILILILFYPLCHFPALT